MCISKNTSYSSCLCLAKIEKFSFAKQVVAVLKSLLQLCYAVMLAFVVLSSPSICTAHNNVNFNASKVSIDTSPFYLKSSAGIATNYDILDFFRNWLKSSKL
ncbi:putative ompA-like autotransporter [Orientia tsutsugamushi str. Boryong]|uniref:Putative ompA-like autotransporter n=1 Tax=Orientia tsutsugamushi (strain Boryong) TaxID=357244 RepID=A5CF39_ORITB|nr:putative ompA-like autotransporter [Orientia tsutsugamushi str. Boryong]